MVVLGITLLVVFMLAVGIVLLRLVAKLLGAGNPSWGASVLVNVIPSVVQGLGYAVGMPELAIVVVSLVVGLAMIVKFFDTSVILAIAIIIVYGILISIVMSVAVFALIFIFGAGILGMVGVLGLMTPEQLSGMGLEQAMEPGQEITIELDQQGNIVPDSLPPGVEVIETSPELEPEPEPADSPPPARPKRVRHTFQEIPINTASSFVGGSVRIHYKNGRVRKGTLTSIEGDTFNIEQKASGGSFEYSVTTPEIKRLEAWKPIN